MQSSDTNEEMNRLREENQRLLDENGGYEEELLMYERERQEGVSEKQMLQMQLDEISTRNQELFGQLQQKTDEAERTRREMQQLAKQFESSLIFRN